ncbi:MAG: tyrosine-type recombinase/integrase [Candidatus Hinthialibacter sp.]
MGDGHIKDFRKTFDLITQKADLEWVTPHVLRHTFGSILAQEGIPIQQIAKLMGHSDIRVTIKHYTALLPSNLDIAMEKLPI